MLGVMSSGLSCDCYTYFVCSCHSLLVCRWSLYKMDLKRDKIGVFVSIVSTKIPFKVNVREANLSVEL